MPDLALSGLTIGILIPLAAFGVPGLATVVATHELAEVLVIANGVLAGRPTGPAHSAPSRGADHARPRPASARS